MNSWIRTIGSMALIAALSGAAVARAQDDRATSAVVSAEQPQANAANGNDAILLNFRNAPLTAVLEHLSKAAGFIIVNEVQMNERVDVWSYQTLNRDEAVNLLDTVLHEKGYAAVRNDRTLLILSRDEAAKRAIRVMQGGNPDLIPHNDEIVTQIIPVLHANALLLVDNIKGLLPDKAIITANESSNAIVLTDTQNSVNRVAQIIRALDTSISGISTLKVFPLKFSDAKEAADLINKVFETQASSNSGGGGGFPGFPGFGGRGRRGGDGGDGGDSGNENSEARKAASKVLAAADERTNALVVMAPEELLPTIEQLVKQIDTSSDLESEIRVFTLRYSDAEETAKVINSLYNQNSQANLAGNFQNNNQGGGGRRGGGGGGGIFRQIIQAQSAQNQNSSQRKLKESQVNAVADVRTNSVVVTAVSSVMEQIKATIMQLDSNSAKAQKVFVYNLKNASVTDVAEIIDQMFNENSGSALNRTNANNAARTGNANARNSQNNQSGNRNSQGGRSENSGSTFGGNTGRGN